VSNGPFNGWPDEALDFFRGLEADNTKSYWVEHQDQYNDAVKGPMLALADEVEAEFGPLHLFRPYRDVRFSKDKTPYKTQIGAVTEGEGGEVYYVALSATGLMAAAGYHMMANDQIARFCEAVDDDTTGPELEVILAALRKRGFEIGGEALKTAPRGYPRDHPRVTLLRHKGVTAAKTWPPARWLDTRAALKKITDVWRATRPLDEWLAEQVGPSTEPPPER